MDANPVIDAERIALAADALRRGEVIGLPTETVYGLAGDAGNDEAVRRIFALKGRPADHPVIVHLAGAHVLERWARNVPAAAQVLAQRFWPGPLTLILQRAAHVSDLVTGGQDTVGLRVPAHPLARALLDAFGGGIAAPSANRYGHVSPTTAQHVREEFGSAVPLVLDGGPCPIGIESTIVDLSGGRPRVLRPGRIAPAEIEAAIGPVALGPASDGPRTPGSTKAHYAPGTPVELLDRAQLEQRLDGARRDELRALVLAIGSLPPQADGLALPQDAPGYARHLYAALRQLDAEGADCIVIERPPQDAAWAAVGDRLQRAAAGRAGEAGDAGP